MDWGGLTLRVNDIEVGSTAPGVAGTSLGSSELDALDNVTGDLVQVHERTFTETSGAGTYTASVVVPAGAYLLDVIIHNVALWDNAGNVSMEVGYSGDSDAIFTAVDLKATDLLAGESATINLAGGLGGSGFIATAHPPAVYSATEKTIVATVTTASTGGSAGRTRLLVVYALPSTSTAATKA
jgi:hypothetical protein